MKNEEKAPLDTNKRGKGFGRRKKVWREAFDGTSEALNALQVKLYCGEGNKMGRFSECLHLTTAYLSTRLEGGGDIKTSIRNGKVFDLAWPDPAATKAMLHVEYRTRENRVDKLHINLSTAYAYGLVIGQCTDCLRSRLGGQEIWEATSNKRDLLGLLKSINSLSHKYDKDMKYHHVSYHTLLR